MYMFKSGNKAQNTYIWTTCHFSNLKTSYVGYFDCWQTVWQSTSSSRKQNIVATAAQKLHVVMYWVDDCFRNVRIINKCTLCSYIIKCYRQNALQTLLLAHRKTLRFLSIECYCSYCAESTTFVFLLLVIHFSFRFYVQPCACQCLIKNYLLT